jgi:hypothetical protein
MADPIVDPSAPPPLTPPVTPPLTVEPMAPKEPEKPKAAYVVLDPIETPTPDTTPDPKSPAPSAPTGGGPGKDQIVSTGALTIVMVKTTGSPSVNRFNAVKLPRNAADLSVVEVHRDPASTGPDVAVFPNKNEQIGTRPINDGKNQTACAVGVGSDKPKSFRKMSKTLWVVIS